MFVMFTANGDAIILAGTGYDLTKIPRSQTLGKPGLVKIKVDVSFGMLDIFAKKPQGSKSFLYELSPDPLTPESTWLSVPGSKTRYTFANLTPGKKYWVRIAAVGKDNELSYGDLYLSQYVQ
jgi:Fibronectin type III domain